MGVLTELLLCYMRTQQPVFLGGGPTTSLVLAENLLTSIKGSPLALLLSLEDPLSLLSGEDSSSPRRRRCWCCFLACNSPATTRRGLVVAGGLGGGCGVDMSKSGGRGEEIT